MLTQPERDTLHDAITGLAHIASLLEDNGFLVLADTARATMRELEQELER